MKRLYLSSLLSDKPMFIFQKKTDWNIECYITDQKSGTLTNFQLVDTRRRGDIFLFSKCQ